MEQRAGGERKLLIPVVVRISGGVKCTYNVYVCDLDYLKGTLLIDDPMVSPMGSTQMLHHNIFILSGLTLSDARATIYHEVAHAFISEYGLHFNDSDTVECVCDFVGAYMVDIYDTGCSILDEYRNAGYIADEH